jgi:hypothetical protein
MIRSSDEARKLARMLSMTGRIRAMHNGHKMTVTVPDTEPFTWIASCTSCGGFMVVDTDEDSGGAYGRAVTDKCTGRMMTTTAPRRDSMEVDPCMEAPTLYATWQWSTGLPDRATDE